MNENDKLLGWLFIFGWALPGLAAYVLAYAIERQGWSGITALLCALLTVTIGGAIAVTRLFLRRW